MLVVLRCPTKEYKARLAIPDSGISEKPALRGAACDILPAPTNVCRQRARRAETGRSPSCGGRSLTALLAPAARNSVLRFRLDWPASVSQVAPHLFAYGAAYFLGNCGQRLTGGTATAFKGTIIGVE